ITSVIHSAPHTTASMSNYGIARDESRLIFKGTGTIEKALSKPIPSRLQRSSSSIRKAMALHPQPSSLMTTM
ncbi:MAG: SufD family Fe-S cluster assembly protein, partial [Bacilli bacterium]|nr:SufD family Fe-S cluster assembly protein [Bacilli bacterium]